MGTSQRLGDLACDMLEQFILSDPHTDPVAREYGLHEGGHLWNSDFYLIHEIIEELLPRDKYSGESWHGYILPDETETPPIWPLDVGFCLQREDGKTVYIRLVTVEPHQYRGLARLYPPQAVAMFQGEIVNLRRNSNREIWGRIGGRWAWLDGGDMGGWSISDINGGIRGYSIHKTADDLEQARHNLILGPSIALTHRYCWHAAFGFNDNGPRIVVPTNPEGCLALFRSRDKAPGSARRAALRHWVENHYRESSSDPAAIIYVRDHLRGIREFTWNGLIAELMPSAYDLERNEAFRDEAAAWRAARKHNAVRLRRKMPRPRPAAEMPLQ